MVKDAPARHRARGQGAGRLGDRHRRHRQVAACPWELLKYVDGLSETVWWHHGRCPSYGDGITFWALGEMVRMRAGIAETDSPGVSRSKLAASVASTSLTRTSGAGSSLGWPSCSASRIVRPVAARSSSPPGATFFERISDAGTVVMVFEDLQWADTGLLDFIESLLEWSRNRPIFIVTLARPELADRRPAWGAGHQEPSCRCTSSRCPTPTMTELVRGLVPGADVAHSRRIVERAEGMPLYAVEVIRMLADCGVLRAGEDAYELVG